ncbi:class I SAM-dependent methyltransferase [Micromonospora krabiensis]|uniref:class I SAM-dependent methyltransferase n=1 Tax=Micromonospora krabiensis TaxID=307121 RepID=UPI0012FE1D8C|nr:class I SAM-dependent methyltransferase [Micromonospora krabiensis]
MPLIDYYGPQGWGNESPPLRQRQHVATELVAKVLAEQAEPLPTVLDVGCGDGSFLAHLAATLPGQDVRWIGVDYSEHQLARAAALPYEFHRCDLGEGIPLPDASVDLVHAGEVLEHLYDPDRMLEECARVLRPGGHLVLTTPNLQAWYNRALFLAGIQPIFYETSTRSTEVGVGPLRRLKTDTIPVGHLRLFNRTALVDLLRREGFEPLTLRGAGFHGVPSAMAWLDTAMCRVPSLASILVVLAAKR